MTLHDAKAMPARPSRELPRTVSPSLLWTGGCVDLDYGGETVHSHFGVFLVKGSEKTLLVDSGHPIHAAQLDEDLDRFLDGRPLDYVFLTHGEFPHAGLIAKWLDKYPQCRAVGDLRDYDLYYPELACRIDTVKPGDAVDLGDRQVLFVPAVWRDLPNSLWAFDTLDRVLFVADAFSFLHYHYPHQCAFLTSEMPAPDVKMIQFFNERALQWTRYTDPSTTFNDIDALLGMLRPRMIAPAHGSIIDTPDGTIPLIKQGMVVK